MPRTADTTNYQELATEFSVGDKVAPFGMFASQAGRVTAVYPAIGMVDVEMPTGNRRWPVEDLQRFEDGNAAPTYTSSVPGGTGTVSVPGGPFPKASSERVAQAHLRQALYWAQNDRQYKMTRNELDAGRPCCPTKGCDLHGEALKKTIYKRRGGASTPLLGCPGCLFLIKDLDIVNHPAAVAAPVEI